MVDAQDIVMAVQALERTIDQVEAAHLRRHAEMMKALESIAFDVSPIRNDAQLQELTQINHSLSLLVDHFMPSDADD